MNTIQVRARHAMSYEVEADVNEVINQTVPLIEAREIGTESAIAIASWWQSSGSVGSVLAAFASGCEVDRTDLLDDIAATRRVDKPTGFDATALDCLATFVINYT